MPAGQKLGGPDLYFDTCAFSIPVRGFLGTAGRNILRGPGFATLDFSVSKDSPLGFLGESGALQFRAEFFNLLNRPNFLQPARTVYRAVSTNPSNPPEAPIANAGRITSTSGTSRQVQLALKLIF